MQCYKNSKIIFVQQTLVYDIKEEKLVLMAYFWHIQKHFTPSCTFIASFNIAKRLLVLTGKCMVPEKGILSPCYMNPYQGEQISVYKYSNLDISKNKAIRLPQPSLIKKTITRILPSCLPRKQIQLWVCLQYLQMIHPIVIHAWKLFYCFPSLDFIFILYSYYNFVVHDRNHTIHDFTQC